MQFRKRLETGEFACLVQIDPPKGTDVSVMVNNALNVKGVVDAFLVPEMTSGVMRMTSLGASLVLRQNGLGTIMQVSCRDRNRLALQGDILAANALGIDALMVVTGEEPSKGDHVDAKAVYDITLDELLAGLVSLENGRDFAGVELNGTPDILKGAALETCLRGGEREKELDRMKRMIDLGVRYFITQPLFEFSMTEPFLRTAMKNGVTIIPTVLLLKSLGMARYMARNVSHVTLPDTVIQTLQQAPDKVRASVEMAKKLIAGVREHGFGGVNVSCMGWEGKLPEILGVMEGLKG
ncbi:MAG: methylenetetrahydrofolate reductase [Desulfobacterium sp.]|nr:methylenetetrahydrofolate reductase [Desulfobacterium sp.]